MQYASRVSAVRRELNSHEAASPQYSASVDALIRIGTRRSHGAEREDLKLRAEVQLTGQHPAPRNRKTGARRCHARHHTAPDAPIKGKRSGHGRQEAHFAKSSAAALQTNTATFFPAEQERRSSPPARATSPWQSIVRGSSARRCLTLRSRRGPTAGHQARSGGTRYIFTSPGLASCRRSRLTSNVRRCRACLAPNACSCNRVPSMPTSRCPL